MVLPLETNTYTFDDIDVLITHRHGDVGIIFMHQHIAIIIADWDDGLKYKKNQ